VRAMADWATTDNRRMLHAVYRVGDLNGTIEYYKKHFGMEVRYRKQVDVGMLVLNRTARQNRSGRLHCDPHYTPAR
jgi:catechol 2,3-dioxygenase-like lactoylglutathione lyase family enzyme